MYFDNSRLQKIWLDKCLKSRVSEYPLKENIASVRKHCCNLNGSTFTIFIKQFEGSSVGKSLF